MNRISFIVAFFFLLVSFVPKTFAAQISGVVLGNNDNPLIGAEVIIKDPESKKVVSTGATDFSGTYTVTVPDGTYDISVVMKTPNGEVEKTFVQQALSEDTQKNFSLATESNAPIPPNNPEQPFPVYIGGGILFLLVLFLAWKLFRRK